MMLSVWLLLSILHVARASQAHGNLTSKSAICESDVLKIVSQKLQLLETGGKNLRLKMDNLNMKLNLAFEDLKATCGSNITLNFDDICKPKQSEEPEVSSTTILPLTTKEPEIPSNCAEAVQLSGLTEGIHKIRIPGSLLEPIDVYCVSDPNGDGGAWTLIQRRLDGTIDFELPWAEYVQGFGSLQGEFWIGLEKIHELTKASNQELWIQMEDFQNDTRWAKYSGFAVGNETESFALKVSGSNTTTAGDSLLRHVGQKFTTIDKDNDLKGTENCAEKYSGAWWYADCLDSNLNGIYLNGLIPKSLTGKGIVWYHWKGLNYSLKYVHMAIRPLT